MNDEPTFSVVIPNYNHASFLQQALANLVKQTFPKWEAIIIDNYSTDNSQDVCNSINDPRVSFYKVNNGGSIALSRNFGISVSKYAWICFHDADDLWEPNKLQRLSECIANNDLRQSIISHSMGRIDEFGSTVTGSSHIPVLGDLEFNSRNLLLNGNFFATSSITMSNTLISQVGNFDQRSSLLGFEDYEYWVRVAASGASLYHISENLGQYRVHSRNQSKKNRFLSPWPMLECVADILSTHDLDKLNSKWSYDEGIERFRRKQYHLASYFLGNVKASWSVVRSIKSAILKKFITMSFHYQFYKQLIKSS